MRFLNPKTDFAFKKIFGSAESHDILLSLLNAVLRLPDTHRIVEVEILDPYQAPKIIGVKDTYVDVKAKDAKNRVYIIEMQVLNYAGMEKRALYNACKAYVEQLGSGEDSRLLADVIAITFTDFVMFPERSAYLSAFKLRADDGGLFNDDLQLVFAELPKFAVPEQQLQAPLDKWLYFLRNAGKVEEVPAVLAADPAIAHAFAIANRAGLSREELDTQEGREHYNFVQRNFEATAEARGEVRGRAAASRAIASGLLNVLDDATIAAKTGLAVAEVAAIRAGPAHG